NFPSVVSIATTLCRHLFFAQRAVTLAVLRRAQVALLVRANAPMHPHIQAIVLGTVPSRRQDTDTVLTVLHLERLVSLLGNAIERSGLLAGPPLYLLLATRLVREPGLLTLLRATWILSHSKPLTLRYSRWILS